MKLSCLSFPRCKKDKEPEFEDEEEHACGKIGHRR